MPTSKNTASNTPGSTPKDRPRTTRTKTSKNDPMTTKPVIKKVRPELVQLAKDQEVLNTSIRSYNLSLEDIRIAQSRAQLELDEISREQLRIDQDILALSITEYNSKIGQ